MTNLSVLTASLTSLERNYLSWPPAIAGFRKRGSTVAEV